ncbi:hypothetical protein BGW36DRAFT_389370 [Talaromyces proteolyticus]|uniref:Uncharacterized protein n=1 Tax=Talaromyces proteolyticus TaxID=1131652 RepID=A0AAD4KFK5_9EURO|nr:uncharacterized protein BGW36DRAFT_389370 [Talaromyces proteolyticus]KAH8690810.1 hypothetical protein BGW36DRAFT_389370 [Talaromyces proteolyticus]
MAALGAVYLDLARRGTADEPRQPSPLLHSLVIIASCIFVVTALLVDYTYGRVVFTLAAIEDPRPTAYVRLETDDDIETPANNLSKPPLKPITSSISDTIAHLQVHGGGRLSRFRGIGIFALYMVATAVLILPIGGFFALTLGSTGVFFAIFLVGVMLINLEVAWIHTMISRPSQKSLWSRIPAFRKAWVKLAPAAFLQSLAGQLVLSALFFLYKKLPQTGNSATLLIAIGWSILCILINTFVTMSISVVFIRIAASMLPEDEEAIVPFDRTFGHLNPEVSVQAKFGVVDAVRSVDWNSMKRLLKVMGWYFFLMTAVTVVYILFCFGLYGVIRH